MYNLSRRDGGSVFGIWGRSRRGSERDSEEAGLWTCFPFPLSQELAREATKLSYLVCPLGPSHRRYYQTRYEMMADHTVDEMSSLDPLPSWAIEDLAPIMQQRQHQHHPRPRPVLFHNWQIRPRRCEHSLPSSSDYRKRTVQPPLFQLLLQHQDQDPRDSIYHLNNNNKHHHPHKVKLNMDPQPRLHPLLVPRRRRRRHRYIPPNSHSRFLKMPRSSDPYGVDPSSLAVFTRLLWVRYPDIKRSHEVLGPVPRVILDLELDLPRPRVDNRLLASLLLIRPSISPTTASIQVYPLGPTTAVTTSTPTRARAPWPRR